MRLFVAVDVPEEVVRYIHRVQQQVKREVRADRWQPVRNLHLTLHFLGEVDESLVPAICADLDLVSSMIAPFSLAVGGFGAFPRPDRPRVLWLGVEGDRQSLVQTHQLLGKRFDLHPGLARDRKPYAPHITLARGPHATRLPLSDWNVRFLEEPSPRWQVEHIRLYRSELYPSGAVHTPLYTSRFPATSAF